jgi:hypothetical protein
MIFKFLLSARSLYYVIEKETSGRRIMHLFKTLKYRREVGDGVLNRPLSLHQWPFDEQNPTVSSGSVSAG